MTPTQSIGIIKMTGTDEWDAICDPTKPTDKSTSTCKFDAVWSSDVYTLWSQSPLRIEVSDQITTCTWKERAVDNLGDRRNHHYQCLFERCGSILKDQNLPSGACVKACHAILREGTLFNTRWQIWTLEGCCRLGRSTRMPCRYGRRQFTMYCITLQCFLGHEK